MCNVACNSEDVYNKHLSGKKHAAQISLMSDNGIGSYLAAFKHLGIGPWKKGPKKISTQPAWCELCKISCNSRDVYMTHLAGRKHLRNLGLLSKSNNALQRATNPVVRPQERPNTCEDEGINSHKPNKAAMVEDIEAKKRKLIKGGAAETDIRICTLCNVVCNSQTVFNFHLAGQKHAVMVKLMMQKQPGLLAEMSNNFRSDTDTSFNAEELLKIKTRCRELRKEKDMINCSQSQIFELLRIIELHEKSLLETSIKDKTHIQRLEEELLNCSQEIDYLKDQLNGRNMEVKYLQELVYSFKLKIKDMEGLQDEVIRLKEELQRSSSEQFFLLKELVTKEMELEKSTLSVEKLKESISSMALESECEVECMKLDMMALEQSHFEAKKIQEETLEENTRMSRLIGELQFKFQEAQKNIVSLNEENKKLNNKIDAVNVNTGNFSQKVEEWLEKKDRSQLNGQSSLSEQEKGSDISKDISVYGEVLGPLLGRLSLALETDADIKEEMQKMSHQMQKYKTLVEKLKN
ncbi:centrosomal protein of 63 kDa isoform X2 [Neltuma alba]|uniref:centrosomal protein of 63 kDa isoform X2 n=1 Tax=Neltuma alba TaxID=207710 RepID=UPI0010A2B96D|nr:centrosomal protein of 63 kDa-like isoform X2 [Prosopis alba]